MEKAFRSWSAQGKRGGIMEGYCVKCKGKCEIVNGQNVMMRAKGGNERPALKGKCATCGTVVFKILPSAKK